MSKDSPFAADKLLFDTCCTFRFSTNKTSLSILNLFSVYCLHPFTVYKFWMPDGTPTMLTMLLRTHHRADWQFLTARSYWGKFCRTINAPYMHHTPPRAIKTSKGLKKEQLRVCLNFGDQSLQDTANKKRKIVINNCPSGTTRWFNKTTFRRKITYIDMLTNKWTNK